MYLKTNPNRIVFTNRLTDITERLFSINLCSTTMSIICLQSMAFFFEFSPDSAVRNSERIMQVLLDSVLTQFSNTTVIKEVNCLLSKISANLGCKEIIKNTFIPFTLKLIYKNCPSPLNLKMDVPERGLELLNTVIKFYPESLDDSVILQSFCKACVCILEFNDTSIMEVSVTSIHRFIDLLID